MVVHDKQILFEARHVLYGNWATLLLPIDKSDQIDWSALSETIDILLDVGPSGIYTNGTAGEFYNQTEEEFCKIQSILAEKASVHKIPFQIGCSDTNPMMTLRKIAFSKELQPMAIQFILPDWTMVSDLEMVRYVDVVSKAADPVPLVLYHPPAAKKSLQVNHFKMLAELDLNIIGIKVAGGDQHWYKEFRPLTDKMAVFIPGHFLASGINQGMQGSYSNVSCLNPYAAQAWYQSIFSDQDAAIDLEKRLMQFMQMYIKPMITEQKLTNQGADKLMAAIGNWGPVGPRLRWPYIGADATTVVDIREKAAPLLPEFIKS